jgi:CubicO group peptidase (beta-lactamase class C family)
MPDSTLQAFADDLDSLRQARRIPGLAAAVVKDRQLAWTSGYGSAHFDTDDGVQYVPVTPDTPFWIASVTKTFIGLLFLQLDADGTVDLDDRISDMPGWTNFCTWLAQSGIVFGRDLRCDVPITLRNVLHHRVNGTPGTRFLYNPIMYSRLSRYIEHVYGHPISAAEGRHNTMAQLVQDRVLGPVGMNRSMASLWQREKADVFFDMAQGYGLKEDAYVQQRRPERHLAGGAGIVSTVRDLARYDVALSTGALASESVMDTLFTPPTQPDGTESPYAFGWYVQNYRGERLVWHAGWDEEVGFSALYLKVPERGLTLILLANSEGLWWGNPLDRAVVEQSPFAQLFLNQFVFDASPP